VVFIVLSGKNEIYHFWPPLENVVASHGKGHYCLPGENPSDTYVHSVWLMVNKWKNTLLWS